MKSGLSLKRHMVSLFALLMVSSATGALLVHDNFDYTLGTTIAAGGTLGSATNGFENAWKFDAGGLAGEVVAGLEFKGVGSSGNALKLSNGGSGHWLFRGLTDTLTSDTYYVSMLFYRDDANDFGSENWSWELKHSSSYSSGPGSSTKVELGSTSGELVEVNVAGGPTGTGTATYNVGSIVFMLAKLTISDSGSETAWMKWYDIGSTVPEIDNGIAWDASSTGEFTGGKGWKFNLPANITSVTIDEFRLGTELADVVPAPQDMPPTHPSFRHVLHFIDHYKILDGGTTPRYLSGSGTYTNGSPLKLLGSNGQLSQRWAVNPLAGGQYRIRSLNTPYDARANDEGDGWDNKDPVQLHSWMDWDSQKWMVDPLGDGKVAFQMMDDPGFYLSAAASTNNAPMEVYSWQDEARQKWVMDIQETIQSPYILRGSDGNLLAFFRHNSSLTDNEGLLYASADDGQTWSLRTAFGQSIYGPTLFVHSNALYMIYSDTSNQNKLQLKKSTDHGFTWSNHVLSTLSAGIEGSGSGVIVSGGFLYYGFADTGGGGAWPMQFRLRVASCPVGSDLTVGANWTITAPRYFPGIPAVSGTREGWLEPNCVEGPDGRVWVVARVDKISDGDVSAILKVSTDRTALEFANQYPAPGTQTGFINAPWAGSSKFHILYDNVSSNYLAVSNPYLGAPSANTRHPYVRNILALYESTDLKNFKLVKTLVDDDSFEDWDLSSWFTGFQYPAFIIDGSSLKYVCRTAYKSYDNYHDGNMGTYHELENFREHLSPDGEMAYYRLDEQNDPGLDSSKMSGNYADVSDATYVAAGRYGGCLSFDGTNDGLGLMHRVSPKLHRSKLVSVSVWIKNNTDSGPVFTSAIDGAYAGLGLQILYGKLRMSARSLPSDALQTREFNYPSTGEWHHVVAQWNFENNAMRLWLDNVEQTGTGTVAFGSQEYTRGAPKYQDTIGRHFNGSSFFNGCIDEVHIYARALDVGEIAALFNGPGYGEWSTSFSLAGGAYGDDDSDGLVNLHEYGLGGDPTNSADTGYAISFFPGDTNDFRYVYPRRTSPDAGLAYRLETSSDLVSGSWTNAGYVELPSTGIIDSEFEAVTNQIPLGDPCGFLRLRVEQL